MGTMHPPTSNAAEAASNVPLHYLILAHMQPGQLRRLIDRLDGPDVYFYIHVDLKSDLTSFTAAIPQQNVCWIGNRISCIWGDFSIVNATLLLIKAALKPVGQDGMCVLLSGQDYPVKSSAHIRHFFAHHAQSVFLDFKPAEEVWPDFAVRTTYYKLQHSPDKLDYTLFHKWDVRSYLKLLFKGQLRCLSDSRVWQSRKLALPLKFYGGSQWWAMPVEVLSRVYDYIRINEKELFDFFQDALIPDEFFFQSMFSLPEIRLDNPILSPVTYVRWDGKKHPQPVVFRAGDEIELQSLPGTVLFARKFDSDIDSEILEKLDSNDH